jgi:hypothetical protein
MPANEVQTFRIRAGDKLTVAAAGTATSAIPKMASLAMITTGTTGVRVLVKSLPSYGAAVPANVTPNVTNMGYLFASVPVTLKLQRDRDAELQFQNPTAGAADIYINYAN